MGSGAALHPAGLEAPLASGQSKTQGRPVHRSLGHAVSCGTGAPLASLLVDLVAQHQHSVDCSTAKHPRGARAGAAESSRLSYPHQLTRWWETVSRRRRRLQSGAASATLPNYAAAPRYFSPPGAGAGAHHRTPAGAARRAIVFCCRAGDVVARGHRGSGSRVRGRLGGRRRLGHRGKWGRRPTRRFRPRERRRRRHQGVVGDALLPRRPTSATSRSGR